MNVISNILLNDTVKRNSGFFTSDMVNEKVLLSIKTGKYYNLGEIGGQIWELLENSVVVRDLISKLTSSYNVEFDVCQDQVTQFLDVLCEEELIEIKSS